MEFNFPSYEYIKSGNIYTGSKKDKNYKIYYDKNSDKIIAKIWEGRNCIEKSEIKEELKAEFNEEKYIELIDKIKLIIK